MKHTLLALTVSIASLGAAQAQTKPLNFVAGIGLTAGGDKLATASYTNGDSVNIKAGSGAQFLLGLDYRLNQQFSVQGTVGYHIHLTPDADNGDASFSRVPVELIGYFHANPQWRVGGGVRFVNSVKLNGSGAASHLDRDFQNATGAVVEVEYFVNPAFGVKARVVNEKFKPEGSNREVSGNHFGLFGNFYF